MKNTLSILSAAVLACAGCNQSASEAGAPPSSTTPIHQASSVLSTSSFASEVPSTVQASSGIAVASSVGATEKQIEPVSSVAAQGLPGTSVSFKGEFTSAKALQAIFGNVEDTTPSYCIDCTSGTSKWSPGDVCNKDSLRPGAATEGGIEEEEGMKDSYLNSFMETMRAKDSANTAGGYAQLKVRVNDKDYVFFVIETELSFCNACSALISATKWEGNNDEWRLVNSSLCLAPLGGAGGYTKPVKLVKTGDENYSLIFHDDYDDWGKTLIASPDSNGGWQVVFNKVTDNGDIQGPSSCAEAALRGLKAACWKYSSVISFAKGMDASHYDLIQTTSGTTERNNKVVPYKHRFLYRYKDGRYFKEEPPVAK